MKRYTLDWVLCEEDEAGGWVRYEDIQEEFDQILAAREALKEKHEEILKLVAEVNEHVQALEKAGDRLAHSIPFYAINQSTTETTEAWWKLRGPQRCTVCWPKENKS